MQNRNMILSRFNCTVGPNRNFRNPNSESEFRIRNHTQHEKQFKTKFQTSKSRCAGKCGRFCTLQNESKFQKAARNAKNQRGLLPTRLGWLGGPEVGLACKVSLRKCWFGDALQTRWLIAIATLPLQTFVLRVSTLRY